MSSPTSRLCSSALVILVGVCPFVAALPAQDIQSSSGIFIERPPNPPVHQRSNKDRKTEPKPEPAKPGAAPPAATAEGARGEVKKDGPADGPAGEVNDKLEDALAIGNAARDDSPPRYQVAERAYRLATELGPRDPRPHFGLANIYYDQGQLGRAAEEYRAALGLQTGGLLKSLTASRDEIASPKSTGTAAVQPKGDKPDAQRPPKLPKDAADLPPKGAGRPHPRTTPHPRPAARKSSVGMIVGGFAPAATLQYGSQSQRQLRFYLASTLLRSGQIDEAESQLRMIDTREMSDPSWYATLGYYFAARQRLEEAAASVEKAISLAPQVAAYHELLGQIHARRSELEPRSAAAAKELEGTKWRIRNTQGEGECKLSGGGELRCSYKSDRSMPFKKGRWRTEGEMLHLYDDSQTSFIVHCVGSVRGREANFSCRGHDDVFGSWAMLWVKK